MKKVSKKIKPTKYVVLFRSERDKEFITIGFDSLRHAHLFMKDCRDYVGSHVYLYEAKK